MNISWSKLLIGIALGVVCALGFGLWADFSKLAGAIHFFSYWILAPVLLLTLVNYLLRFLRWKMFLQAAEVEISTGFSFWVFLSGLSMSITPGKLGEVIKVGILRDFRQVPVSRSFPVVVSERLFDLFAILILAAFGVLRFGFGTKVLVGGVMLTVVFAVVLASPIGTKSIFWAAARLLRRKISPDLYRESQDVQMRLLAFRPLLLGLLLSCVAWFLEALGLYLIVCAFDGASIGLESASMTYALGTLAGAVSMLPGGLVATEITFVGMLSKVATLPSEAIGVAATLLVRFATLWFGVFLGIGGLLRIRRIMSPRL